MNSARETMMRCAQELNDAHQHMMEASKSADNEISHLKKKIEEQTTILERWETELREKEMDLESIKEERNKASKDAKSLEERNSALVSEIGTQAVKLREQAGICERKNEENESLKEECVDLKRKLEEKDTELRHLEKILDREIHTSSLLQRKVDESVVEINKLKEWKNGKERSCNCSGRQDERINVKEEHSFHLLKTPSKHKQVDSLGIKLGRGSNEQQGPWSDVVKTTTVSPLTLWQNKSITYQQHGDIVNESKHEATRRKLNVDDENQKHLGNKSERAENVDEDETIPLSPIEPKQEEKVQSFTMTKPELRISDLKANTSIVESLIDTEAQLIELLPSSPPTKKKVFQDQQLLCELRNTKSALKELSSARVVLEDENTRICTSLNELSKKYEKTERKATLYKSEIKKMKRERMKELSELEGQREHHKALIEAVEGMKKDIIGEIDFLTMTIDEKSSKIDQLSKKNRELEEKLSKVSINFRIVNNQHSSLVEEFGDLKEKEKKLAREVLLANEDLVEETQKVDNLAAENEEIKLKLSGMENLKEENMELKKKVTMNEAEEHSELRARVISIFSENMKLKEMKEEVEGMLWAYKEKLTTILENP